MAVCFESARDFFFLSFTFFLDVLVGYGQVVDGVVVQDGGAVFGYGTYV